MSTKIKNKKPEHYHPNGGDGMASICEWGLTVTFKTKEQAVNFIDKLIHWECNMLPDFNYEVENNGQVEKHIICIHNYSWACNLTEIAKMLEEVDWHDAGDN